MTISLVALCLEGLWKYEIRRPKTASLSPAAERRLFFISTALSSRPHTQPWCNMSLSDQRDYTFQNNRLHSNEEISHSPSLIMIMIINRSTSTACENKWDSKLLSTFEVLISSKYPYLSADRIRIFYAQPSRMGTWKLRTGSNPVFCGRMTSD